MQPIIQTFEFNMSHHKVPLEGGPIPGHQSTVEYDTIQGTITEHPTTHEYSCSFSNGSQIQPSKGFLEDLQRFFDNLRQHRKADEAKLGWEVTITCKNFRSIDGNHLFKETDLKNAIGIK